ncbi:type II toxin-antitoxin system HicA family toxin [Comamonas odontotermitis]|uniref:type II toxin-antitoxin system HicA family toxin n=1 Tax=Comamonas odontotermitis TaxID=379895 RepID=UPI00295E2B0E|nr:type II toxin-antitoxin system HicA family toxin [Comamonas odontotermitis]
MVVKQSEFRRYLASLGATFQEGARHTKVYLNGKQTVMPRHPSRELMEGTRKAILKQLGINE